MIFKMTLSFSYESRNSYGFVFEFMNSKFLKFIDWKKVIINPPATEASKILVIIDFDVIKTEEAK